MRLAVLFLFGATLSAQTTFTTVVDVIVDANGARVTGSCQYRAVARFSDGGGEQVVGEPVTVNIANGAFSAKLLPTPAGQYYSVTCSGNRGWRENGAWIVPTSATPLKWRDIWAAAVPLTILLPPAQINAAGVSDGLYCLKVVSNVVTGLFPCGTSTSQSWAQLTSSAWSNLTSSIWSGVVQ